MRILVQRVSSAHVEVGDRRVAGIGRGLLLLVGIGAGDQEADVEWSARKIASLRIFYDAAGRMNLDVRQAAGAILSVSQFTLYADVARGNRPGFEGAEKPEPAKVLWGRLNDVLRAQGLDVAEGEFGAEMQVSLVNDGPVTIWLDSGDK